MNVVDSSLWLDYFDEFVLDRHVVGIIEDSENQYVPSICIYEVFKKMLADKGESIAQSYVAKMQMAPVVNLSPDIALVAAKLSRECKLPMADSIIYATAKMSKSEFYTQDRHFAGLDGVRYFAKSTGGAGK